MPNVNIPLVKAVVSGTLANGVQDFSFGLWLDGGFTDFISQATLDGVRDDILPIYDAYLGSSDVAKYWTSLDKFDTLRCYFVPATGNTATLVSEAAFSSPIAGGGTANHPKQTSLVVSLRTQLPGRSGRGRFYLPATGIAMTAGGVLASSSDQDALGVATQTFINALQVATYFPVVASFTKSITNHINSIQIDNVPDTQRRRTDKIVSTHLTVESV